ncbi:MAG: DNA/RNA nuclease SfsA [Syntrophobacterales bacterium]|nr:DNA/RNA nuclease SfsA [Syntrophobacterales bacterium]
MGKPDFGLTLFPKLKTGIYIRRVNRFVIECSIDGKELMVHLPNPGRLWELLFPGSKIYLVDNQDTWKRKTRCTAVAVERKDRPVLLHTQLANTVVKWLLEDHRIPGLEDAEILKSEAVVGHSRFDFLLQRKNQPFLLEVKSCTLFGNKIAMFPDAITARGKKHVIELAELSGKGMHCGIIFIVHCLQARYFLPDYHTDFEFARALYESRNKLILKAIAVEWGKDLTLGSHIHELVIPWDLIGMEAGDSGSYILILHIPENTEITVGKLGAVLFRKGYYLYAGSARKNLKKRIERHLRKRKKFFWHIDYLRDKADYCMALPIRSRTSVEHELAEALSNISDWFIQGFGSSDCSCKTHLFGMQDNPIDNPQFMNILLNFRINRLEREL